MESTTVVQLEGVNGVTFNLTTGDKGVYLATDVTGAFYDPPVKCVYEEPGNYPGSRYLNHRILRREIQFGVEIFNDAATGDNSWVSRDSAWRKAWAFDKDCILSVTTTLSGTRKLKLRLIESPVVEMTYDPQMKPVNRTVMLCVAGDPFWYEADAVYTATTTGASGTLSITVPNCNPTDQYIFPKWTLPGSTVRPSAPYIPGLPWLGAPTSAQVTWTVPDYAFEDAAYASRRVKLPGLIGGLRTDEIQVFNLDGIISGGTFTLTFNGETTGTIPWDASVAQVKAALESTATVAYDDVVVTRGPSTREVQILTLDNATGGTFTLSFGGQTTATIPYNATDTAVKSALVALPSIQLFDLMVKSKATNSQQLITVTGEPQSGTFTLTFDGYTTGDIAWNATAAAMKTALVALPNIDINDITVDRQVFKKYSPWTVTFTNEFKGVGVPLISGNPDNLEGGAGMDVVVSEDPVGSRPYVFTFKGARVGQNVPDLVVNGSGLTKADPEGPAPTATMVVDVQGSFPYICQFQNACSGVSYPLIVVNTAGLTGYSTRSYRSWKTVTGYTAPAENCFVDVDPRVEQVVSESGSNLWARMNGVRFRYPIPPYTTSKTFTLDYAGAVSGQMASLRLTRPWSRPWGLE